MVEQFLNKETFLNVNARQVFSVAFVGFSESMGLSMGRSVFYDNFAAVSCNFQNFDAICVNADTIHRDSIHSETNIPILFVGSSENSIEPFIHLASDWYVGSIHSPFFNIRLKNFLNYQQEKKIPSHMTNTSSVELAFMAFYDKLTGLVNRSLFEERCRESLGTYHRALRPFSLFFLDMDQFKNINDQFSHKFGDQLLAAIAERLRRCVRREDTVSRFGGDEFALLFQDVEDIEALQNIANRIANVLKAPFIIQEQKIYITCSIGVASVPQDGTCCETLLHKADQAMYKSKKNGGSQVTFVCKPHEHIKLPFDLEI